jgi:hypothetical protein
MYIHRTCLKGLSILYLRCMYTTAVNLCAVHPDGSNLPPSAWKNIYCTQIECLVWHLSLFNAFKFNFWKVANAEKEIWAEVKRKKRENTKSTFFNTFTRVTHLWTNTYVDQGCQIFLGTWYQNRTKCTKSTQHIPNGHKISQMPVKYSKWP